MALQTRRQGSGAHSRKLAESGLRGDEMSVFVFITCCLCREPSSDNDIVWTCANRPSCRFYLWEDHLVDALKYHEVPEDVIEKMTPRKRKRDHSITEYFPITPKTPRTRDAQADGAESDDDIYEMSDREASPSSRGRGKLPTSLALCAETTDTILSMHADSSPTPLPRRSNAPSRSLGPPSPPSSWEEALDEAAVLSAAQAAPPAAPVRTAAHPSTARPYNVINTLLSAPVIMPSNVAPAIPAQAPRRPNTPPPTARPENPLVLQPRTPRSRTRGRTETQEMPPPDPRTPGSGRRRLSVQEFHTYNAMIRALAGANVKLSVKGQNALRDIVKEEDFWLGS